MAGTPTRLRREQRPRLLIWARTHCSFGSSSRTKVTVEPRDRCRRVPTSAEGAVMWCPWTRLSTNQQTVARGSLPSPATSHTALNRCIEIAHTSPDPSLRPSEMASELGRCWCLRQDSNLRQRAKVRCSLLKVYRPTSMKWVGRTIAIKGRTIAVNPAALKQCTAAPAAPLPAPPAVRSRRARTPQTQRPAPWPSPESPRCRTTPGSTAANPPLA
jgi:hypothetical protein